MFTFVLRRVVSLVFVLFCVVTITFLLIRLAPGGPFDRERKIPPQIEKALMAKYKLDGTLWQQYRGYMGDLLHGDLLASINDNLFLLIGLPALAGWLLMRRRRGQRSLPMPAVVTFAVATIAWTVLRNLPGFPLVPTVFGG